MKEPAVKTNVHAWLGSLYEFVQPEFVVEDGTLDFLAANWPEPGYLLDIIGVECKGESNAPQVWGIANEQLGRYSRYVPRLYFACSLPNGKQRQAFIELCRVASVGFVGVGPSGPVVSEPPSKVGARFKPEQYLKQVRSVVAMLMVFEDIFGPTNVRRARNWCSTKEPSTGVQWNAFVEEGFCYFGLNIENSRKLLASADLGAVTELIAKLPSETRCLVSRERYFGPGRRATLPLLRGYVSMLKADDLEYIKKLSATATVHVTFCVPVWTIHDAFTRNKHREEVLLARAALTPIRVALTT